MKPTFNDKLLAYLVLFSGLAISGVAEYYSIMGLIAIYPAALLPIVIMGIVLGIGKISGTVWLKQNWEWSPFFLRAYVLPAIVVLMMITSLGVFGFLSKAHSDQALVSGDVQSKIAVYDEKIKTEKENIEANRKALKQMDEGVDQVLGRSADEKGADKAVALRRSQQKERSRLQAEISQSQKSIAELNEARAPIAAEVRKVEAEVGPIKYIARLFYGENTSADILEKAVVWVTVLIVIVLDPLAVVLLLASQYSFQRLREQEEEDNFGSREVFVADVGEKPTEEEKAEYEQDDGPLTEDQISQLKESVKDFEGVRTPGGDWIQTGPEFERPTTINDMPVTSEEIDEWNRMLAAAEKAVAQSTSTSTVAYQILDDDSEEDYYMTTPSTDVTITHTENGVLIEDGAGVDVLEVHPDEGYANIQDLERPGDYITPPAYEPPPAVAINEEYLKVGDQMVHYKAHDHGAKNAYDAVARHKAQTSTYVQNEEQIEADTKWKEITAVSEDKYQETAKKNQESN